MPKQISSVLFIALFMVAAPVSLLAQFGSSSTTTTPIWGAPINADPIWGSNEAAKPSTMTSDPIWNPIRNSSTNPNRNSNQSNQQQQQQNSSNNIWNRQQQQQQNQNNTSVLRQQERTDGSIRSLNISSRLDTLGNLVQDTTFVQIGDSSVAVSGSINDDMDNILPPPDDPVDAPIDNGVALLIAIGLASGYNQFRQKKKVLVKA